MASINTNIHFHGATPILRVQKLANSLHYYKKSLGFKLDWGGKELIAAVSRGSCSLILVEGDQGNPGSWVWIGINDVVKLHSEFITNGAKIRHAPTNYWWAYEMQVEDLDGNVLRFGSEPQKDMPIGQWLDMNGVEWQF
ncbi:bleomycin resistance family protein [Solitalea longa]|uniref:Bleomycin resistance protein n=1 Tax=Solitalea longa TaxID=2079460 RepID=A0A2S4ZZ07_9SPHI|nr:glyoxalase superfamily protein [Solitalea longa]POY35227.1 bleomycin resistance family protein [Solitalea longa]